MASAYYSQDQLAEYLDRIQLRRAHHSEDPLLYLSQLIRNQLIYIPFETLGLHYSVEKDISLDPEVLFSKIVRSRRGGYCFENNTFFGHVLRSLGFELFSVICRMSRGADDGSWRPISHLANIVTVNNNRYLVDVGYGVDGPIRPLPLESGVISAGLPGQQLRLEYKVLPQHRDPNQRVWVYSQRRGSDDWRDLYHFPETEFFPADFEILNFYTMKRSLWSRAVVVQRFLSDEDVEISKTLLLSGDEVRMGDGQTKDLGVTEKRQGEEDRVGALGKHFGIFLSEEQQGAIRGTFAELRAVSIDRERRA